MEDQAIRNRMVRKMLRNNVTGAHKAQMDTVVGWAVATDKRGRAERLLEAMATDPACPVEAYGGGHRSNVRLTSLEAAVDYLKRNDGDVPFGFD